MFVELNFYVTDEAALIYFGRPNQVSCIPFLSDVVHSEDTTLCPESA